MADRDRWPTFLGLGALKAGTTLLHDLLDGHPEVCLPAHRKEIRYFCRNYERGAEWYLAHFRGCDRPALGEISSSYLHDRRCPDRIRDRIPDARLIATLRNPIDRAYSQFRFWITRSGEVTTFERFLDEHPNALERGRYHEQLRRYLDRFPREQLEVILFDDLTANPRDVARRVYRFIGVDPDHRPDSDRPVYATRMRRFPRAYILGSRLANWLYRRNLARVVAACKRTPLYRLLATPRRADFPPLGERARRTLVEAYREDVEALGALLDRDLGGLWGLSHDAARRHDPATAAGGSPAAPR